MCEKELEILIDDIYKIIKPKEERFTLNDFEILTDSYCTIKNNKILYFLAKQKHKNLMTVLQCLLGNGTKLIEAQNMIYNNQDDNKEIKVPISNKLNVEELILLNYLYNLTMEVFFKEKKVTIKLYQEEKNKCLQKK